MKIIVIGVPFNGDGTTPEIENPAQAFRDGGLIYLLKDEGHQVSDIGDLSITSYTNTRDSITKVLNFGAWRDMSIRLSKTLGDVLNKDTLPIVLGGDCSVLVGIFDAYKARNLSLNLFFLDGHADFHDTNSSSTGEPADLELAALTGHLPKEIVTMTGRGPLLDKENVVVYGINEYDLIDASNITVIDRKLIFEKGIESTFNTSLSLIQDSNLPLWLHFDVDVMDKVIMPAIQYPVEEGLSYDEILELFNLLRNTKKLVGVSISCYHPNLDFDNKGMKTLLSLLNELFKE